MTKIKEKKKMGLTTRIFAALLAGVVLGVVLCYFLPDGKIKNDIIIEGILYVIGQGFIRLMKMLVVPLVFCSLDLRKYGNWRYEKAGNSRSTYAHLLSCNDSDSGYGRNYRWKYHQSRDRT